MKAGVLSHKLMTTSQKTLRDFIIDICTAIIKNGETPTISCVHRILCESMGQDVPLAAVIAGVEDWKEAYSLSSIETGRIR